MEVHHHPHIDSDSHRKKGFKEYFLEFVMIFLAVTLGFIGCNKPGRKRLRNTRLGRSSKFVFRYRKVVGLRNQDFIPISDAMQNWKKDFEFFDNVQQVLQGYPDYLHYKKGDVQLVQSWWTWTAKSKKTGEVVKVPMVIFDEFNADGKISREYIYGDFSKLTQEEGM